MTYESDKEVLFPLIIATSGRDRCGACTYNRRKCIVGCFLTPYFQYLGSSMNYAAVHRIFGQRNFISLIAQISKSDLPRAINSLVYEAISRLQDPILGCVSYMFSLEQQVQDLKEQISQLQAQSSDESLKQNIDPDLHHGLNFAIDDPDLSMVVYQDSMLDLVTTSPSSPSSSRISSPTYIPPVTMDVHQDSMLDLITTPPSSPSSSRISSPTHIPLVTPPCTASSRSHWSDLVQHFRSSEFKRTLSHNKKQSDIPSSSNVPTPATDPYFFFNANRLTTFQNSLAPPPQNLVNFTDLVQAQEVLAQQAIAKRML